MENKFANIIITTRYYPTLIGKNTEFKPNCNSIEIDNYVNLYFSGDAQKKYGLTDNQGDSTIIIKKISKDSKCIFILPCIDLEPSISTDYILLLKKLCNVTENNNLLLILHKSDFGLDASYMEKLLTENELQEMGLDTDYKIIVFQHDDANSPNIYKNVIVNSLLEGENFNSVYKSISEAYNILSKPWGKLIEARKKIICGQKIDKSLKYVIESNFDNLQGIDQSSLFILEKAIVDSPIVQIN